ncbi:MAG: hypothetical protein JEZ06_20795 [Anaerolineaceae bacterium]|nr:hypothetical protein [Anaerolineaceae bacterium]
MAIYSVPGKMEGIWREDIKAVVDTWADYFVTLDEFKEAVLGKGVPYAKAHGAVAWIVDSSKAKGVFSQEIQDFIGSDIFPNFANNGIKYFITITSTVSAVTKMNVSTYAAKAGPHGLQLLELNSVADAEMWLKTNA